MKGAIKFIDGKTSQWGFITPSDGSDEIFFHVSDIVGTPVVPGHSGMDVEYEVFLSSKGPQARNVRLVDQAAVPAVAPARPVARPDTPGSALTSWAFVPFIRFKGKDGREYGSVSELLASRALKEPWHFGDAPNPEDPFPILENYLKYTFFKVKMEGKVKESGDGQWATFNTGLVDRLYDPVFALFVKNPRGDAQPWYFFDFCVPGTGPSGKRLTAVFDPLPEPASYFTALDDMLLDTTRDVHVDYEHVIRDGIRRGRFPAAFLRGNTPKGIQWKDHEALGRAERDAYLAAFTGALEDDVYAERGIKNRLEDAITLAEKRTRWNFKTAIPQYYPRLDFMSLLLPLALMDDEVVGVALVVTRNPSGSYQGRTVLNLRQAYQNARLVCRPDSDWLIPQAVKSAAQVEADDEDDGE